MQKFWEWEKKFTWVELNLGLTNKNYLLEKQFLLRREKKDEVEFIQRENEIKVLPLLENQNINVPVLGYFFDQNNKFTYITKFLSNAVTFDHLPKTEQNLIQVSQLIKRLHSINIAGTTIKKIDLKQNLLHHMAKSQYKKDDPLLNWAVNKVIQFLDTNQQEEQTALSHNDPLLQNILFDPKSKQWFLIDYEYCSLNSEYYDIAVFAAACALIYEPKLLQKWMAMFNITSPQQQQKIRLFMLYRDILAVFWGLAMKQRQDSKDMLSLYDHLIATKMKQIQFANQMHH